MYAIIGFNNAYGAATGWNNQSSDDNFRALPVRGVTSGPQDTPPPKNLKVTNPKKTGVGPRKSFDVAIDGKRYGGIVDFNAYGALDRDLNFSSHAEIDISASGKSTVKESKTSSPSTSWVIEKPGQIGLVVRAQSQAAVPKWIDDLRASKDERFVSMVAYLNGYLVAACTFSSVRPADLVMVSPGTNNKIGELIIPGGNAQLTLYYGQGQCALFPAGAFIGSFK